MSDLRKIAEDAVAGIGPDAEDVIDAARDDTAQAVAIEREAIAVWLTGKAKAMRAINRDGSRQLDIAAIELLDGRYAEALRNGEHTKGA